MLNRVRNLNIYLCLMLARAKAILESGVEKFQIKVAPYDIYIRGETFSRRKAFPRMNTKWT